MASSSAAAQLAAEFPPTQSTFVPRQAAAIHSQIASMRALSGTTTTQLAAHAVSYLPQLTYTSMVHDNGAGDGTATKTLLSLPSQLAFPHTIWATDIPAAAAALDSLRSHAAAHSWPRSMLQTAFAPAESLAAFPDGSFTHSITNSVIARLGVERAAQACSEIRRTLAPGGTAVISVFGRVPHRAALAATHAATRPLTPSPLVGGAGTLWDDGTLLRRVVIEGGGFRAENVRVELVQTVNEVDDLDAWAERTWSVLGRPAGGWLVSDEENWEMAVGVFREVFRRQEDVELLGDDNDWPVAARLTNWGWVAVAVKEDLV